MSANIVPLPRKAPTGDIGMIMTKCGDTGPVADIVRTMRATAMVLGPLAPMKIVTIALFAMALMISVILSRSKVCTSSLALW